MEKCYLPAPLLLALMLALCGSAHAQCNLRGTWTNELLSNMTISSVDSNGQLSGVYLTQVSLTNKTIVESPLIGYKQMSESHTFGFTVNWAFADSITVWTGQCIKDSQGHERLVTMWLLREKVNTVKDSWSATRVGQDIFKKTS